MNIPVTVNGRLGAVVAFVMVPEYTNYQGDMFYPETLAIVKFADGHFEEVRIYDLLAA